MIPPASNLISYNRTKAKARLRTPLHDYIINLNVRYSPAMSKILV